MGKGDKRSRKGKIWRGSYGVSRKRKKKGAQVASAKNGSGEAKAKKAPAKKAAAKKKAEPKKSEE